MNRTKFFLLTFFLLSTFSFSSAAQPKEKKQKKEKRQLTVVEQRAEIQTKYLEKSLLLTEKQREAIFQMNVKYNQTDVPDAEKNFIDKDLLVEQLRMNISERTDAFGTIFTGGQFNEYMDWVLGKEKLKSQEEATSRGKRKDEPFVIKK